MNLRTAYDLHYHHEELSKASRSSIECHLKNWEKLTDNPPVEQIDNATVEKFRAAMLAEGYSPVTVNATWKHLRAILRRIGPVTAGNPWALELIPRVPAMRPVPVPHKMPRRVALDDLSRLYVACKTAQYPRVGIEPVDWWRGLLVTSYTTGLRRGDLASITWDAIDLQERSLTFTARKTHKSAILPLHPACVSHLLRIRRQSGLVFAGLGKSGNRFCNRLHRLQDAAEIAEHFTLKNLRATAASEVERVRHGMAGVLLQHHQKSVTHVSYLNESEELREAVEQMRLPIGFASGPKMAERELQRQRQERIKLSPEDFAPTTVDAGRWRFGVGWFEVDGERYALGRTSLLRLLQELVTAGEPVTWQRALEVLGQPKNGQSNHRVRVAMHSLRKHLRGCLGLSDQFDPVPIVSRDPGGGGAWTIALPK